MESGAIADGQMSASSQYDADHSTNQGRLHFQETLTKSGSWAAATNDANQWLQIDLGNKHTRVTRVATQGRNANSQWWGGVTSQWITRFKLQYSDDGVNFHYYREQGQNTAKVRQTLLVC